MSSAIAAPAWTEVRGLLWRREVGAAFGQGGQTGLVSSAAAGQQPESEIRQKHPVQQSREVRALLHTQQTEGPFL